MSGSSSIGLLLLASLLSMSGSSSAGGLTLAIAVLADDSVGVSTLGFFFTTTPFMSDFISFFLTGFGGTRFGAAVSFSCGSAAATASAFFFASALCCQLQSIENNLLSITLNLPRVLLSHPSLRVLFLFYLVGKEREFL